MTDPHDWGRGNTSRIRISDVPKAVLTLVRLRDGWGCVECNRLGITPPQSEPIQLDHKQPLALGGDNRWENLQFLCRSHNQGRQSGDLKDMGKPAWLRRQEAEKKARRVKG